MAMRAVFSSHFANFMAVLWARQQRKNDEGQARRVPSRHMGGPLPAGNIWQLNTWANLSALVGQLFMYDDPKVQWRCEGGSPAS